MDTNAKWWLFQPDEYENKYEYETREERDQKYDLVSAWHKLLGWMQDDRINQEMFNMLATFLGEQPYSFTNKRGEQTEIIIREESYSGGKSFEKIKIYLNGQEIAYFTTWYHIEQYAIGVITRLNMPYKHKVDIVCSANSLAVVGRRDRETVYLAELEDKYTTKKVGYYVRMHAKRISFSAHKFTGARQFKNAMRKALIWCEDHNYEVVNLNFQFLVRSKQQSCKSKNG